MSEVAELWLDDGYEEMDLMTDDGHQALIHTIRVDNIEYGVLYVPIDAGFFAEQGMIERELGKALPLNCYELKFALRRDFDGGAPDFTSPEDWDDLSSLSYGQSMALGRGIFQSTWMLRSHRDVRGLVMVALVDRPKLAAYYGRLLKKYQGQLGFGVHTVLEGKGYALV
ncbi:hypothetical protein PS3A_46930 [Pseudomonas sp. 3A(2025)]